jgi:hypothetical protein
MQDASSNPLNIRTANTFPPLYNWNIVESGVKHHNPSQVAVQVVLYVIVSLPK